MNCMASTSSQSSIPLPSCLEKPLPLDGFQGTPDEVEQQWYDQVYLGSGDRMKQLTWRAVIVGMLLGSILSLTNLYANLKMGWSFGVALTAGIISFALWNAFVRLGISKSPMTILENTCMQSAASSAGYSTGGTLTSAVAALLLLTGQHMPLGTTFACNDGKHLDAVQMAEPHAQCFRCGRPCSGSRSIESLESVRIRNHGAEGQHGDEGSQKNSGKLGDELFAGVSSQQVAYFEVYEQVCRGTGRS